VRAIAIHTTDIYIMGSVNAIAEGDATRSHLPLTVFVYFPQKLYHKLPFFSDRKTFRSTDSSKKMLTGGLYARQQFECLDVV
jgi:hypothetical protein